VMVLWNQTKLSSGHSQQLLALEILFSSPPHQSEAVQLVQQQQQEQVDDDPPPLA
jgi:hypothetical protein